MKQHYLPCVYLGNFGQDVSGELRKRRIYRNDNGDSPNVHVTVESQGVEEFFYDSLDPEDIETDFGRVESDYGRICRSTFDAYPTHEDLKRLLAHFIVILARGKSLENELRNDSFYKAFGLALYHFAQHLMYDRELNGLKDPAFRNFVRSRYVEVVLTTKGEPLITSDNPAIVLVDPSISWMVLGLLPMSPEKILVIYDKQRIRFKQTRLSFDDVSLLNGLQASNSHRAVYSRTMLSQENLGELTELFARRLQPIRVSEDGLDYAFRPISVVGNRLSFIKSFR